MELPKSVPFVASVPDMPTIWPGMSHVVFDSFVIILVIICEVVHFSIVAGHVYVGVYLCHAADI